MTKNNQKNVHQYWWLLLTEM